MPEQLDALDSHYKTVIKAITDGLLVSFLDAGVNLCGRPQHAAWQRGQYLPSGGELSAYLAENFGYPVSPKRDSQAITEVH